jgi:hypothetical protein
MPLVYGRLGDAIGPSGAATAAAGTALAVVPLILVLSSYLTTKPAGAESMSVQ